MKKTLQILGICVLACVAKTNAQVALENHLPPFGASFTLFSVSGSIPDAATGANQVWDYSSVNGNAIVSYVVKDPATLPAAIKNSVPSATFANQQQGAPSDDKAGYDFFADKTTCYVKVGTKGSGNGAVDQRNDTIIRFGQAYGSNLFYNGMNRTYAGYGTLKIGGTTYTDAVMLKSNAPGSTDTLVQFHHFTPCYQLLLTYVKSAGTTKNVIYSSPVTATGIEEKGTQSLSLQVYPNPSAGIFNLAATGSKTQVFVYSIAGEMIYSNTINGNAIAPVNLGHLDNGLYILQSISDGQSATVKITIQK